MPRESLQSVEASTVNQHRIEPDIATILGTPPTILLVSDLHLGAGQDPTTGRYRQRENFLADHAFREFLDHFAPAGPDSALLVINGDAFDFLRIDDIPETDEDFAAWGQELSALGAPQPEAKLRTLHRRERRYGLRTNNYKSVWKLSRIAAGHPGFFAALGWWIAQGGAIVFVKGNHDLELYWPLVQQAIRRRIAQTAGTDADHHVLFVQDGFQLANVYIEHGHRFDPQTAVKGEPLLKRRDELNLPLGSFVNRYVINPLEGLEPFLDNIKPVQKLLWTVVRRHPLRCFSIARNAIPFLQRAARPYWVRDSLGFGLFFGSILLQMITLVALPVVLLWPQARHAVADALPRLRYWITAVGLLSPYALGFLHDLLPRRRPKVGEDAYAEGIYEALSRLGFCADHPRIYGVVGHTHVPDVQELPALTGRQVRYLNSGTWIPLWDEDRPDLMGRVVYSFIQFTLQLGGWYSHSHGEWHAAARTDRESIILDRGLLSQPGAFLSARQRRTAEAFAEVFIEGQREVLTPRQIADNLDAHLMRVRSKRTGSLRLVLFLIEYVLPLLSLKLRPFSRLTPQSRRKIIERRLVGPRASGLGRTLAKIRALFLLGYYGDPRAFDSIGYTPPARQDRYQPEDLKPLPDRPRITVYAPAAADSTIYADVCVIGSGAGGAVVAHHAAAAGASVVVLEEGRYIRSCELTHSEPAMSALLYKESGLQSTVDLGMTILQGHGLGGTTFINNAICFRLDDRGLTPGRDTLRRWAELGAVIDSAALADSYDAVLDVIQAKPLPDALAPPATAQGHSPAGTNGDLLLRGWQSLVGLGIGDAAFQHGVFRLNFTQCLACGYCNFGCPYERRMSVLETYLPAAAARGARIIPECHVVEIETRRGRATVVRGELADGRAIRVAAGKVVVACGAIGSSVLLMKSGITRNVGTRFSCNVATPILARYPQRLAAYEALQMTAYVDARDFLLESTFNPPVSFAVMLPGWFATHFERARAYDSFAVHGVVLGTEPNGQVKRWALLRDLFGPVGFQLTPRNLETLKRGMALLAGLHFAAGAQTVLPSTFIDSPMPAEEFAPGGRIDQAKITRHIARFVEAPGDLTLNTAHPQGGNPMSDDRSVGAIDSRFRVHGFSNLFVCDASVFPTSIGINPQLTIMALADYAWRRSISQ
jgi:choline dehydrogenase-like flavoprotein/UDP-2,3-diacylglucosamine pyrophosphatase LpxH